MSIFEVVLNDENLHILACHIEHLKQISSALSQNISREDLMFRSYFPARLRGNFYSRGSKAISERLGNNVPLNETEQKVYDLLMNFHDRTLALENAVSNLDVDIIPQCANELLVVLGNDAFDFKDPQA